MNNLYEALLDDYNESTSSKLNLFELGDGNYAIYSGDTDQDGFIDFSDLDDISSWAEYFLSGYRRWDLTGDLTVESEDYVLTENNVGLNLQVQRP